MRLGLFAGSLLLMLAIVCCTACYMPGLAKHKQSQDASSYALDEGVASGGVMPPMEAAPAPETSSRSMDLAAGEEYAPGKPGQVQSLTVTQGNEPAAGDLERWFSPAAYAADTAPDEEYLIRSGTITLKVDSFTDTAKQIEDVAARYKGTITDTSMEKQYDGTRSGYITLRIPKESFFTAWSEILKLGDVENQNQSAQDVGREYVAAMSRMQNLMIEQQTLREMLADAREVQRTRGLGEAYSILLQTEQRLSEVTGELQVASDQVQQLADQITRSTITVQLTEKAIYQADEFQWDTGETFRQAEKDLLVGFKNTVNGVVYFLVTMWLWLIPLALVVAVVWLILLRVIRASQARERARRANKR